jgi:3D (Asp-Asp-Asp) domain-containing protein
MFFIKKFLIIGISVLIFIGALFGIYKLSQNNKPIKTEETTTISTIETTIPTTTTSTTTTTTTVVTSVKKATAKKKKVTTTKKRTTNNSKSAQSSGTYKLTHYGPDCRGCGGNTASGYNVKNTIYYNDSKYGKLRIVAMCSKYKLYSIIKIKNYKLGGDLTAIVLDRGVGCRTIDLLVESEKKSSKLGIQKNVSIEILRVGKK